ncbi:hypothetical protein FHX74_003118 [Friedmanniella endophytica]|uniref:Uncharacterized protein n=1 Tax=Microlunatus kandeliicorticis TaxID=1759536 RepID=A0A7W3IUF7_9ACTN|nr:hypothetical protein [Microlunatus kandeliicorticis]MBA8795482.1 hypothetical protein [Microlunatus kandeliicorticis]
MSIFVAVLAFAVILVVPVIALIRTAAPETRERVHRLAVSVGHTLAFDPRHPQIHY